MWKCTRFRPLARVRNITTDEFAGGRQMSTPTRARFARFASVEITFHPEFATLPRKFKIAMCASREDRAVTFAHDIGLYLLKTMRANWAFAFPLAGGLGRTPMIGSTVREFCRGCT